MRLTIHYRLRAGAGDADAARGLVERLRQDARRLPFRRVGPLLEFRGRHARPAAVARDHELRGLLTQAQAVVENDGHRIEVPARHAVAFSAWPSGGPEECHFGLARYPVAVEVTDRSARPARLRRRPTGLAGWRWEGFCRTGQAADPERGELEDFLRCHLAVVALLDRAAALGLLDGVDDPTGYWAARDLEALAEVGDPEMLAPGWTDRLRAAFADAAGSSLVSVADSGRLTAGGRGEPGPPDTGP